MNKKLTIIFKNNPNSNDDFDGGTYDVTYDNSSFYISGDYMVIESTSGENTINGNIFHIKTIKSYRWE